MRALWDILLNMVGANDFVLRRQSLILLFSYQGWLDGVQLIFRVLTWITTV